MSDAHIKFCFGIHNHQPVGNFGWVFEEAAERSYVPFLDLLGEFPGIRVAIHTTGPLIEWFEEHRPEYIDKLGALVDRNQVEILGGGFYEPILTMLPWDDALEQLHWMRQWVHSRLGATIRGIWLTERIWEPSLPLLLSEAGVDFTICDTTHFQWAGLPVDTIRGYYITEKIGRTVAVFPIDRKLRYTIPFHDTEETVSRLVDLAETDPGRIITYADDGEKFGVWPGTYNLVYERQWLRRFFEQLGDHPERIRFIHFGEVLDSEPPEGRVMLPVASYLEMTRWALPARAGADLQALTDDLNNRNEWESFEPFIRGGFWDNFLVKYSESNLMYKRMLRISAKVAALPAQSPEGQAARRSLYRGQCNCAYWHGLFGGLYLNYLRDAVTRNLLEAQNIADRTLDGSQRLALQVVDFDGDGRDEVVLESDDFDAVIAPSLGAAASLIDLRKPAHAITSVLTRRLEAYHEAVRRISAQDESEDQVVSIHDIVRAKETGLADHLVLDPWDRMCFQDHFLADSIDLENYRRVCDLPPNDFIQAPYRLVRSEILGDEACVQCRRTGLVHAQDSAYPLTVEKTFVVHRTRPVLRVIYRFTAGDQPVRTRWGCELNLTLLTKDAPDRQLFVDDEQKLLDNVASYEGVNGFTLVDGWQKFSLAIDIDRTCDLWHFPVETVNQSEGGYERTYQGSSLTFLTRLNLEPGQTFETQIAWTVKTEENS